MRFRLRPILILLALAILNQALCATYGIYSRSVFGWTVVAFVVGLAASLGWDRVIRLRFGPAGDGTTLVLAGCAVAMTYLAMSPSQVSFNDVPTANARLPQIAQAGFLLTLVIGITSIWESRDTARPLRRALVWFLLIAVLTTGFMLRALVIRASPEPIIDVYNLLRDSADFILQGKNPYANDYQSPYHTERAKAHGLFFPEHPNRVPGYPPLTYLLCTVPRLFGADIRWVHAIMDVMAGLGVFLVALRRNRPLAGLLAASLYLHLPGTVHVAERAWIEPILAGLFGIGFWLVEATSSKCRLLGHVLLGLAFTGKQYGAPMYLPFARAFRRQWRYLLAGLTVGLAVLLPFFLWSPHDFMDIVVSQHLTKYPGYHSITIVSALKDLVGWHPSPVLFWLISGPLLLALSWRSRAEGAECALYVGSALFTYVLFSTVGFLNYFYLVQYLWLLGLVGLLTVRSEPKS
ncbi:MAG TPA: hypothetical protein VKS79_22130 [Gemmataceae bacterium]|nr:hypothetical protein [Gemmataceae bacterium]